MARISSVAFACVVLMTSGCFDVDIPAGARIGCDDDAQCPAGFECREALGLCVELSGDRTPPGIADVTVSPDSGGDGTAMTVSFTADEALLLDPVVELVTTTTPRAFLIAGAEGDDTGTRFVATLTARSEDGDGVRDIRATLTDAAGNVATDVPVGRITLDFSRPSIAVAVDPPFASADTDVVVTVRTSEPLGAGSSATLVDGRAFELDAVGDDPLVRTFRLRPTPATDSEGDRLVDVVIADVAGNAATAQVAVRLDFTPPTIDGAATIGRDVVRRDQVATVGLRASEAIASAVVELVPEDELAGGAPLPLTIDDLSGRDLQLRRDVGADDADGRYTVRVVSLVDLAGNVAADVDLDDALVIDQGAPAFSSTPTTAPTTLSRQPGNDIVTVTFELNERADVDVRMGTVALVCASEGAAPAVVYTCVHGIGADEVDGTFVVTINAVDAAGNTSFATAPSVTIDTSPPVITLSIVPTRTARDGETVSISVIADEALDGARLAIAAAPLPPLPPTTAPPTFSIPQTSGRAATTTFVVPSGLEGAFAVTVVAADLGGNTAPATTTTVAVDSLAPRLLSSALSTPRAAPGAAFSFELVSSETLHAPPRVSFSNGDVGVAPFEMQLVGPAVVAADNRYRYTATAPTSGQNQFYTVTAVLEDVAGNSGVESPAVIVIDNAPPRLAGFDIAPRAAKAGDVVRVVVTADETLGAVPVVVARNGAATLTLTPASTTVGALSYVLTTSIVSATPQGTWTFDAFDLVDAAGNRGAVTTAGSFTVDSVAPTISIIGVTPAAAKVGSVVSVTFTTSEAIAAPVVVVDDLPMDLVAVTGGNTRFEFGRTITAAQTQGLAPITISVADAAGNVGIAGTAVVLDFDKPGLVVASASPLNAKLDTTIVYTVTPDEPLASPPALTIGGNPITFALQDGSSFIFTATVNGQTASGPRTVLVRLTDLAGNTSDPLPAGGFVVDKDVPVVSAFQTTEVVSKVVDNNVVTTRFTATDASSNPFTVVVRVGGDLASCTAVDSAFTCTFAVPASAVAGPKSVTVEATDGAGNVGVARGVTTFDFTGPEIITSAVTLGAGTALNLNPSITAARAGATVDVAVTLSEPVRSPPTLAISPTTNAPFTTVNGGSGPIFQFKATVSATPSQGVMTPQLTATDIVGNVRTVPASGAAFTIDTTALPPPAVTTADLIVSNRAPWGRSTDGNANAPVVVQTINGGPGAATAGSIVVAYDRPDRALPATPVLTGELGRATVAANGSFTLGLGAVDVADVFLVVVDAAGNVSTRLRVRDVTWTATPGNKIAGSTVENPHRFESRAFNTKAIEQADAEERGTGNANNLNFVFRKDGLAFTTDGLPAFTEVRSVDASTTSGVAWDSTRDVAVSTGGRTGVREFDGVRWKEVPVRDLEQDGNPNLALPHRIVFDPELGRVVLVDSDALAWFWDGVSWDGQPGPDQGVAVPSPRSRFGLAWDPVEGAVLLFGGSLEQQGSNCVNDLAECSNELWRLDGLQGWTLLDDTGPAVRQGAAMAYNFDQGAMILFGGENVTTAFNDTWAWDGGWRQLPATTPPSARGDAAMVHDPFFGGLILVGGGTTNGGAVASTAFFFDGDAWGPSPIAGELPAPRGRHGLVFDEARERWLLVGGVGNGGGTCTSTGTGDCNDTWSGHSDGWQRLAATTSLDGLPVPRSLAAAAYDSRRGRALLFGGLVGFSANTALCATNGPCLDLWELDGAGWRRRSATNPPSARSGAAAAFDAVNNVFVMFGGLSNATCDSSANTTCDGTFRLSTSDVAAAWTRVATTGTRPGARRSASMAWDSTRGRVMMFGGETASFAAVNELWEFNAATNAWIQRCVGTPNPCGTTIPTAAKGAAMAFDSGRGRVVVFGGSNSSNVFEFNGTTWQAITPTGEAPSRFGGAMSYDPVRQRTIYTNAGACGPDLVPCDTWEWNGAGWARIPVVVASPGNDGRPAQRSGHNSVYDTVRKEVVVFGGLTSTWDTWRYSSAAADAAAQAFLVDFNTAGARALNQSLGAPTVTSVAVTWTGSGFGFVNATRTPGVKIVGRIDGHRRDITSDSTDGLRTLTRTFTNGSLIDAAGHITLLLEPLADNGTAATRGAVATDAVEVTVKYRLPD